MSLPNEKRFERRLLHTGSCETICQGCQANVGAAFWEFELDELEARHVCRMDDVVVFSLPPPLKRPVRRQPGQDPATPRRHARRLGRAARVDHL